MKLNNSKKPKKKFNPIKHWYILLLAFFMITLIIVLYSIYSFFYIKRQISVIDIESKSNIQNTTSTDGLEKSRNDTQFLKDVNNLNKVLEDFKNKEIEYNRLIKSAVALPIMATTTASTTVATSTN